jgi:hypothetical protein
MRYACVKFPAVSLLVAALALCSALMAADKRSPQGTAEDESVAITATILSAEQIKEAVGSSFDNDYTVLDVHVTPKGGKPYTVHLEDFILRSESSGDHSGPFVAAQIAGAGALEVARTYGNKANPDSPRVIESTKVEMKNDEKPNAALDALKKKILAEKVVSGPVSGLLFFPLSKEKPKNLVLSYKTPQSKLRLSFK